MGTVSDGVANKTLDALAGRTTYTAETAVWLKLHLGDPGTAGGATAAAEATRKQVTCGSAANGRAISNTAAVEWTNVSTTETYAWISGWDAATVGNFLFRDDLSAPAAVTAGDTFRIPIGDLDLTVT